MPSSSEHWDRIFSTTQDAKLGWYEKDLSKTFELLSKIPNWKSSTIFLPGAGTSLLIEELLSQDVNLVLNDISLEALNKVKSRLRYNKNKIVWNCQDISKSLPEFNSKIDIWIDRAVLHFCLKMMRLMVTLKMLFQL